LIKENLARYAVANVELVPLALAEAAGERAFHVSSGRPKDLFAGEEWNYGNKSSSLLASAGDGPMFGWLQFNQTIHVACQTLDQFCVSRGIERIDFIHMDVQGAESLVLRGASRMLPCVGSIWTEVASQELYRGQKLRGEMEAFMREHGFSLTLEISRGEEGDQFYVNRRWGRGRRRLAVLTCEKACHRLRRAAVAFRRSLVGS
jgi:FkbM family methyltransferase